MESESKPVLVVGGTGFLGRKVIAALVACGKPVRALGRHGSDAGVLGSPEIDVVRGDMLDRPSLDAAMNGTDAVVTTAAGYTRRRKTDTAEGAVERLLRDARMGAEPRS